MNKNYELLPGAVDEAAQEVDSYCRTLKLSEKEVLKHRLMVEEVLNCWTDRGLHCGFTLKTGRHWGKESITLTAKGDEANPFDDGESLFINDIRAKLTNSPVFSYQSGKNSVTFTVVQKHMNQLLLLLIVMAAAITIGSLLKALMSADAIAVMQEEFVSPTYSALFRILGCISGPLILLSVMWGIYGIGDTSTLGLVGRKLILAYIGAVFAIACGTAMTFPLFQLNFLTNASGKSSLGVIYEMLLDIIPANIEEPFLSGNTLQIIFIAVIFGIAMLYLGKRVRAVADIVDQINCIVQFIMGLISKIIPVCVFMIVLRLILNDSLSMMGSVWKLLVIFLATGLLICVVITLITSLRNRVSPVKLIAKSIPTFLIAIATASSAACFGSNVNTCENKLGIDHSLTSFGIPLGMVMFKTATTAYYLLISMFFAAQTGVECSAGWMMTAIFLAAMLAIATPPIPGGAVISYTVLFGRLGIPDDALAIVLSVDILFDFLRTALNMYNLPLMLVNVAASLGLLNKENLRK